MGSYLILFCFLCNYAAASDFLRICGLYPEVEAVVSDGVHFGSIVVDDALFEGVAEHVLVLVAVGGEGFAEVFFVEDGESILDEDLFVSFECFHVGEGHEAVEVGPFLVGHVSGL